MNKKNRGPTPATPAKKVSESIVSTRSYFSTVDGKTSILSEISPPKSFPMVNPQRAIENVDDADHYVSFHAICSIDFLVF